MLKKKFAGALVASLALSLVGAVAPTANAALKPAAIANAGDACVKAGREAKGRGVNGTNLTCTKITTGTLAGGLHWWYSDLKPLKTIDWTIPGNPGGYSLTADVVSKALKTEGLMTDAHSMVYKAGAGGTVGLAAFQEIKGKPNAALITGIAMVGGMATTKSKLNLMDSFPVAKIMREYNAIVVPTSSKYRSLNDLLDDISANGKNVAVVGGNAGGVDHQIMGLLAKEKNIPISKLNYVVLSGGTSVAAQLLAGGVAAGISGSTEFKPFVESGKLRVLGVSSQKRLKGFKGKTFIEQGVNLYYGNWRGIMVPPDLTAAEKLNWLKVMDALHGTPTWKSTLQANNWDDDFAAGDAYTAFLNKEIPVVNGVIKDIGL
jgi:putative tricarboxylic transport membrane protein